MCRPQVAGHGTWNVPATLTSVGYVSAAAGRNPIEQKETKGTKKRVLEREVWAMTTNGDCPVCPSFPSFASVHNLRAAQGAELSGVRKTLFVRGVESLRSPSRRASVTVAGHRSRMSSSRPSETSCWRLRRSWAVSPGLSSCQEIVRPALDFRNRWTLPVPCTVK